MRKIITFTKKSEKTDDLMRMVIINVSQVLSFDIRKAEHGVAINFCVSCDKANLAFFKECKDKEDEMRRINDRINVFMTSKELVLNLDELLGPQTAIIKEKKSLVELQKEMDGYID
jgi:lipoate-protein ligase B